MLGRLVIGSLLAAVVVFFWGFVYWTVLPFPASVLQTLPGQETFINQLKAAVPESGAYLIPGGAEVQTDEALQERHREGPIATLFYRKEGAEVMSPSVFIYGYLHMLAAAFVAGIVIAASESRSYFSRVMLIFWVGVFCAVWVEITDVVWYYFPWDYCLLKMGYHISAALLMGLVLAALVRPAQPPAAEGV